MQRFQCCRLSALHVTLHVMSQDSQEEGHAAVAGDDGHSSCTFVMNLAGKALMRA